VCKRPRDHWERNGCDRAAVEKFLAVFPNGLRFQLWSRYEPTSERLVSTRHFLFCSDLRSIGPWVFRSDGDVCISPGALMQTKKWRAPSLVSQARAGPLPLISSNPPHLTVPRSKSDWPVMEVPLLPGPRRRKLWPGWTHRRHTQLSYLRLLESSARRSKHFHRVLAGWYPVAMVPKGRRSSGAEKNSATIGSSFHGRSKSRKCVASGMTASSAFGMVEYA
jgi:hypothetical protein